MKNPATPFEKFLAKLDSVIDDTKGLLQHAQVKKNLIKEIELRSIEYVPQVQKKIEQLNDLLLKIPIDISEQPIALELKEAINQAQATLSNVNLVVESDWAKENIQEYISQSLQQKHLRTQKYITSTINRLLEGIKATENFNDLSDYTNEIWANYELITAYNRETEVLQALVRRMNETNLKKIITHLDQKDVKKTLVHIRENLFKKAKWSDDELAEYERDQTHALSSEGYIKAPFDQPYTIIFFGMCPELLECLTNDYHFDNQCTLLWEDISGLLPNDIEKLLSKADMVVFNSHFSHLEIFKNTKSQAQKAEVAFLHLETLNTKHIAQSIQNFWHKQKKL